MTTSPSGDSTGTVAAAPGGRPAPAPLPIPPRERDRFLDLVRAVAILRVFMIHAAGSTGWLWWPAPSWILPGMPLVFFTSGALAAPSLERHTTRQYWADRYRRLVIPYWALLGTGLAVGAFAWWYWGTDEWTPRWFRIPDAVIPVVQPRVMPGLTDVTTHLWFMSTFLILIAGTPWLAALHRRRPLAPLAAMTAVFAVVVTIDRVWMTVPEEIIYVPLFGMFLCAGFGYADGTLVNRPGITDAGRPAALRTPVMVAIVVMSALGGLALLRSGVRNVNDDPLTHATVAAGWLVVVLAARAPISRLAQRSAAWLDRITPRTLTLYLWGAPAGVIAWRLALHQDDGWARTTVYVIGTIAFTMIAVTCFGRLEDRAARRRTTPG